jgi:hypothetical protein
LRNGEDEETYDSCRTPNHQSICLEFLPIPTLVLSSVDILVELSIKFFDVIQTNGRYVFVVSCHAACLD